MKSSTEQTFQFSTMPAAVFDIYCCVERGFQALALVYFLKGGNYFYPNVWALRYLSVYLVKQTQKL